MHADLYKHRSWDRSVGKNTGCWLAIWVRLSSEERNLFSLHIVQINSGVNQFLIRWTREALSLGIKISKGEVTTHHTVFSVCSDQEWWSSTFTCTYIFMTWYLSNRPQERFLKVWTRQEWEISKPLLFNQLDN